MSELFDGIQKSLNNILELLEQAEPDITRAITKAVAIAIEAEREACALLVESHTIWGDTEYRNGTIDHTIAKAIRARGNPDVD